MPLTHGSSGEAACEVCGWTYYGPASYLGRVFTCSKDCSRKLARVRREREQGSLPDLPDRTSRSYTTATREVRQCTVCGGGFLIVPKAKTLTCSTACDSARRSAAIRKYPKEITCGVCARVVPRTTSRPDQQYCSNGCRMAALQRVPRNRVDGFVGFSPKGYRRIRVWDGDIKRVVVEHRWVMEQHIGRRLDPKEVVHHKNGDRTDNRIENLELFASQKDHLNAHHHPEENLRKRAP